MARAVYEQCPRPLLAQIAEIHGFSHRQFAAIFGISKSYAEELLNHKKYPDMELGIRIARYFEVTVEEMFGWRIDDDGMRRPLLIEVSGRDGLHMRLKPHLKAHSTLEMVRAVVILLNQKRDVFFLPKRKSKGAEDAVREEKPD